MRSEHRICFADASRMSTVDASSVQLVVTSPPYPMIDMWDEAFCRHSAVDVAMKNGKSMLAFECMHQALDRVWDEVHRVLIPGGIACINVGDATRTINGSFCLYPNHSRIISHMQSLGFTPLPCILWRKQTNAPNKFMGSGMLPPGAYVTLEHEYILIFRKGNKRLFTTPAEKAIRRQSAFFWEERNRWFSDVWMDLKGTRQGTGGKKLRQRSAAFPFEMAYRLICMFSVMGDTVLDPFLGTGTTLVAAATAGRNSLGYELDDTFSSLISRECMNLPQIAKRRIDNRFDDHLTFIRARTASGQPVKYTNQVYGFPVVTRQETELIILRPKALDETAPGHFRVYYEHADLAVSDGKDTVANPVKSKQMGQLKLF